MRLEHTATLVSATTQIQEYVNSKEFENMIARTSNLKKAEVLATAIQDKLSSMTGASDSRLATEISQLKVRTATMKTTLQGKLQQIESFLSQCNSLFLGTGAQNEYLLDICAQNGIDCLETTGSSHVTCCCGYHPFTAFGETPPSTVIEGRESDQNTESREYPPRVPFWLH